MNNTNTVPVVVETYKDLSTAILVIAIIAFVSSASAFVLFFRTKNHRRFPTCILGWIGVGNIIECVFALVIYSLSRSYASSAPRTGGSSSAAGCVVLTLLNCIFTAFNSGCNTLLAATLYITVVKNLPMKYQSNPVYLRSFVLSLIGWIVVLFAYTLAIIIVFGNACNSFSSTVLYRFAPVMAALVAQFVLLGISLRSIAVVIGKVRLSSSQRSTKDHRLRLLILRFVPTIFAQLLQVLPQCIFNFSLGQQLNLATHEDILFLLVAAIIDSLVMITTSQGLAKREKVTSSRDLESAAANRKTLNAAQLTENESSSGVNT